MTITNYQSYVESKILILQEMRGQEWQGMAEESPRREKDKEGDGRGCSVVTK